MIQQHPLLSYVVCFAIDAISYSSAFLNAYEIKESGDSYLFLVNLQPLHPDAKCHPLFCVSSKTDNGSDIQGFFDQIVIKVQMQIPVPAISFDGDPSSNFRHDNFFIWWVDQSRDNGRNVDKLLNWLDEAHGTVPISDPLHLAKHFRSRLFKYVLIILTTNSVRPVNLRLMKAVLGMMSALNDVSRFGKMRDIYPLTIFRMQNIVILRLNGMIVGVVALLSMTLFLTALKLEKVALDAQMEMLHMSFVLFLCMFQKYKIRADQGRQPPEGGSVNDRVTLLTKEAATRHLNTLLVIIRLLRDASDIALDHSSKHPVENLYDLLSMIFHDVNTFN
jgi:hypothetical protein